MAPLTIDDDLLRRRRPGEDNLLVGPMPPGGVGGTPPTGGGAGWGAKYGVPDDTSVWNIDPGKVSGSGSSSTITAARRTNEAGAASSGGTNTVNDSIGSNNSIFNSGVDFNNPTITATGPVSSPGAPVITPSALTQPGGTDGSGQQGGATSDQHQPRFGAAALFESTGGGLIGESTTVPPRFLGTPTPSGDGVPGVQPNGAPGVQPNGEPGVNGDPTTNPNPNDPANNGDDPTGGKDPSEGDTSTKIDQQEEQRLEQLRLQQEQERLRLRQQEDGNAA